MAVQLESKGNKTDILKTSILRKLLEQKRVARNCSKLLEAARRRALSSSLVQHLFAERCSSSFLRIPVFKMLVFFPLDLELRREMTLQNPLTGPSADNVKRIVPSPLGSGSVVFFFLKVLQQHG